MNESGEGANNPDAWKEVHRFSVLDPAGEKPGSVFPTVYVTDELLFNPGAAEADALPKELEQLAKESGWTLTLDPDLATAADARRSRGASTTRLVRLGVIPSPPSADSASADSGSADGESTGAVRPAAMPDAWELLRRARDTSWGNQFGLNHVLTTDDLGLNPFKANPFKANPFKANPFKANPFKANAGTVGIDSYGEIGCGGRQPVTYLGPAPSRRHPDAPRPIVAILDTGCGQHPWLTEGMIDPILSSGDPLGIEPKPSTAPPSTTDHDPDPEREPAYGAPMDGIFHDAAGHGTFIAGIVRQECPDALILPIRVADGDGVIIEYELIGVLGRLLEFMTKPPKQLGGSQVKVLNLSFSFYHEKPNDTSTLPELAGLLDQIRALDCVIVCSAGNEATSRPTYPAAIPANKPGLQVSVGALNPSDHSVALFSNIGDWVEVFAPGVSVLSTIPVVFDGGVQAGTRDDRYGHRRETLDLDDFRGGFGVWSGTSFAAPVVAGRIAEQIVTGASPATAKTTVLSELQAKDLSRMA